MNNYSKKENKWAYVFCGNVREHITVYEILKEIVPEATIDPAPDFITGDCSTAVRVPASEITAVDCVLKEKYLKTYKIY